MSSLGTKRQDEMNDVDREEIHVPDVDGGQVPVGTHLHDVGDVDEVLTSFRSAHLGDVTLELSSFSFFLFLGASLSRGSAVSAGWSGTG